MLYLLYERLKETDAGHWLNFLKYPTFRIIAGGVAALALGMFAGPRLIERLRFAQHGQSNVREDTPDSHQKKKGTPTLGGLLILLSIVAATLLFADLSSRVVWVALLMTVGFGFIGFLDDWLKLSKRNSKGLAGRYKLVLQTTFFLIAVFGLLTDYSGGVHLMVDTKLTIPFVPTHWAHPDLGWFYVPFAFVVVVGTSNAVNLTDGLDGLAIAPTIVAATTFAVLCYVAGNAVFSKYLSVPYVPGAGELAVICGALAGAGLGFLWFNAYPAEVFMGDVGALALGAALGTIAVIVRQEIVLFIMGGVFVAETLSVMLQVLYFKATGGKRIFRMAPLHHHYELEGWKESQVVVRFWIITMMLVLFGLSTLKLR